MSTGENDDRITSVGRIIRKFRIDELPQLINILKGDLSICGPRPERPEIAEEYCKEIPEFALRLQVKAGLTGYAQVYGKYNSTPYDKLEMDLMYIAHPSIFEDFKIMLGKVDIQAENKLENHYTNPYYKDVVTSSDSDNAIDTYTLEQKDIEYTTDLEKIAGDFRKQLVNRKSEITLYYHCSETITNEYFQSLTKKLFDMATEHTGNGKEGDYILWHCQGWNVQGGWSGNESDGYDMTPYLYGKLSVECKPGRTGRSDSI